MENILEILSGAPWWVYVLFMYLVSIGFKSTKTHTVSIQKVVLLPTFFVCWGLFNLYNKLILGMLSLLSAWLVCLFIGSFFGVKEVHSWKILKDRNKGELTLPGNYSNLFLILTIFILKFIWGYFYATTTSISYWIYFTDTCTSALVTGFFVGRAGFFVKNYFQK
jgi:hypothetical protein